MNKSTLISIGVIVVGVVIALVVLQNQASKPKIYDSFAACLGEKGAVFYGAFWWPHCADQKKRFKGSEKLLPYVECSQPDGEGQTEICAEKAIGSYPTWEFADGTRITNVQTLEFLAAKTGCTLPLDEDPIVAPEEIGGSSEAI